MPATTYHVDDNQWHSVAMVVDHSTAQLLLYVDGVMRASGGISNRAIIDYKGQFRAGHSFGSIPQDFGGVLDEIRVSNTAHSAAQINSDFVGYDGPVVSFTSPAIIQSGAPASLFTIAGDGLLGCQVSSSQTGVSVSSVTSAATQIQFNAAADSSVPLGPVSFTITDPLGHTTTAQITVVNQQPFLPTAPGPVLLWHLDESGAAGVTISDSGPLSVSGTAGTNSAAAAGRFTAGAAGTGGRRNANIAANSTPPALVFGLSSFTAEFWVETGPVPFSYALVDKSTNSAGSGADFSLSLDPTGQLNASFQDDLGGVSTVSVPRMTYDSSGQSHLVQVTDGAWHLIEMVVDRSANQMLIYVDGVVRASGAVSNRAVINYGGQIRAGHSIGSPPVPDFPGVLDEIRLLNTARTAAQIHDTWFGTSTSALKFTPFDLLAGRYLFDDAHPRGGKHNWSGTPDWQGAFWERTLLSAPSASFLDGAGVARPVRNLILDFMSHPTCQKPECLSAWFEAPRSPRPPSRGPDPPVDLASEPSAPITADSTPRKE